MPGGQRLSLQNGVLKQTATHNIKDATSGSYTVSNSDPYTTYIVTHAPAGAYLFTLPSASTHDGREITIVKTGQLIGEGQGNERCIRIQSASGTVGGQTEQRMYLDGSVMVVVARSSKWFIKSLIEQNVFSMYIRGISAAGWEDYVFSRNMNIFSFSPLADHVGSSSTTSAAYLSTSSGSAYWPLGWRPLIGSSRAGTGRGRDDGRSPSTINALFVNMGTGGANSLRWGFQLNGFAAGTNTKGILRSTFRYTCDQISQ